MHPSGAPQFGAIDVHAHITPEVFKTAIVEQGHWFGLPAEVGELHHGRFSISVSERLDAMDEDGIALQLLSPTSGFTQYEMPQAIARTVSRQVNESISDVVRAFPDRFAGLGTVPLQDPDAACTELMHIVENLGMRGVLLRDHVMGSSYDEPQFEEFFRLAENLQALLFFHQLGGDNTVASRIDRYRLTNGIGNPSDRTLTFATLVLGGVLDKFPNLRPILAHAGGYTALGVSRLDRLVGAIGPHPGSAGGEPAFESSRVRLSSAPSSYLQHFYYDSCIYDELSLRFIIDRVGVDRVLLGTDFPAPMEIRGAPAWVDAMESLSSDEKHAITSGNALRLLGM